MEINVRREVAASLPGKVCPGVMGIFKFSTWFMDCRMFSIRCNQFKVETRVWWIFEAEFIGHVYHFVAFASRLFGINLCN